VIAGYEIYFIVGFGYLGYFYDLHLANYFNVNLEL